MSKRDKGTATTLFASNKRAMQRYVILERFETGIVLHGSEVKSVRARRVELDAAYAAFDRGELWLHRAQIAPYEHASAFPHEALRPRKLLMHKRELLRLSGTLSEKGLTLVPTSFYLKGGRIKVEVALVRPQQHADKRESLKREIALKEARSAMRKARGHG